MVFSRPSSRETLGSHFKNCLARLISGFLRTGSSSGKSLYTILAWLCVSLMMVSARVFSDPPINISDVKKNGDTFSLSHDSVKWKNKNLSLKDGIYKVGIRPHNITTYKEGTNSIEIKGKVLISELSGSESLIHFRNSNMNWVSLSNGTHQMNVGQEAKLYMNVDEFMYFDQNNNLVNYV
mgnify:CR=1 FL=1